MILHSVRSANDIVQDTCNKIAASDPELNFDFCVKSLGSDPKSHEVDLEGLGLIGVELLQANFTGTIEYIKQLLKKKLEPPLLKALSHCLDVYTSAERKDLISLYQAKRYGEVNIYVTKMMNSEEACDPQSSEKGSIVPPLTKPNADIYQFCIIVLDIMNIL
ncbi:hypothetical protein BT93_E1101 [Corymbia citriodora subsp. variegata]|nr:hypothetical protein BT93_E1101 [Corymbia citriodora subsp. variegata]